MFRKNKRVLTVKVTLKELAEKAGCDISTVSRVLNNKPNRVSQKKRDKILKTAREMEYVTNRNASNLASGKTYTIGILVRNITDNVFAEYIEKIDRYMTARNYSIVPFITHNDPERERKCLMNLQSRQVDAMICLHYSQENEKIYKMLQHEGHILTFRGVDINNNIDFDSVLIDIGNGYYHLTKHLFAKGCRKIGVVGGYIADEIANGKSAEYSTSFRQVNKEAGIEIIPEQGIPCENSQDGAYSGVIKALSGNPKRFDALIVQNTHKVLGVYKALCDLGLQMPEDIKLCAVSDFDFCRMLPVPVTVWAQPTEEICRSLVELTLNRLEFPQTAVRKVSFNSKLIIRKSTGG